MNFKEALKKAKRLVKRYHTFVVIVKRLCTKLEYQITVDDTDTMTFHQRIVLVRSDPQVNFVTEQTVPFDSVAESIALKSEFSDGWFLVLDGVDFSTIKEADARRRLVDYLPKECCGHTPFIRHIISEYEWRDGTRTPMIHYFVQCPICGKRGEISMNSSWARKQWNEGVQDE